MTGSLQAMGVLPRTPSASLEPEEVHQPLDPANLDREEMIALINRQQVIPI
jgi:hypothetical protein